MLILDKKEVPPASEPGCVVPVAADDAFAWLAGRLTDSALLTSAPLVPEVVFIVNLPNRASYKEVLKQCRHWRDRGAVCLIARTGNFVVDHHMTEKNGCVRVFKEEGGKHRILCPPESFTRWVNKWSPAAAKRFSWGKPGLMPC